MKEVEYEDDSWIKWEKIYESPDEVKDREDLPSWFKNYLEHIGEKYQTSVGLVFTLKGMAETNEDLYYYGIDEDGKECYDTCVDKITKVE